MTQNPIRLNKIEKEKTWWRRFLGKLAEANKASLQSGCKT